MRLSPLLRFCAYTTSLLSVAHAFNVTVGTPTQCDDLAVSWTGGQAPFEILLVPVYQTLHNISVPSSAFSNDEGTYSISQLPLKSGTEFLLTMSDATGFGSGGTTTILTVGNPIANNNCNTTIVSPPFTFELPSSLQQCNGYNFTGYDGAIQPITITALIPGGEFVIINPPNGSSYNWVADVEEGTDLLFFMMDSQGRQGGISDIEQVALSSDTSCLNVNSPSSTASAPSQTSSQSTSTTTNNSTSTVGIIAGATVGGVVFLGLMITIGICCRRQKVSRLSDIVPMSSPTRRKYDDYEAEEDGKIHPFPYQSSPVNHLALPIPPRSQPHQSTTLASDPFTQHLRQISYSNSFSGGPYPDTRMTAMSDPTAPPGVFPHQGLPAGLALPIHPGSYSPLIASAGNISVSTHAPFSPMQSSRTSSNADNLFGLGDSASLPMSPTSGQMAGQMPPPNYPYRAHSANHTPPPIQLLPFHASAGSSVVREPHTSLHRSKSSPLGSTTGAIPPGGDAAYTSFPHGRVTASASHSTTNPSAQILVHTDIEDVSVTPDDLGVVELPPQYTDRHPPAAQPTPAQRRKLSRR